MAFGLFGRLVAVGVSCARLRQNHAMSAERPVNLPLASLFAAMPVTAVASILHRASGVVLFFGLLYLAYLLHLALADEAGFARAAELATAPVGKAALWIILTALAYHVFAGVRHLLLDFHIGDSLAGGRAGAWLSVGLAAVGAVLAGAWLW